MFKAKHKTESRGGFEITTCVKEGLCVCERELFLRSLYLERQEHFVECEGAAAKRGQKVADIHVLRPLLPIDLAGEVTLSNLNQSWGGSRGVESASAADN